MAAIVAENNVADVIANAIVAELRSRGFQIGQGEVWAVVRIEFRRALALRAALSDHRRIRRVESMAFEISCPTCTSLGTERTIAGAMKLALAHAPQHSPVYIAGDGARFTIRHDGKPAIEVRFDDTLPDVHHLARRWDES